MRSLAERMADGKTAVVALRIPGHGTAPSGLLDVKWEDMAAAVKIAVEHLKAEVGDGPISIIGYSNGGALAVEYALSTIEDETLPKVEKLVLISPMIGVTKMAALAVWQSRLGRVLGLQKLAWNAILPEYEPYKYGSFALNAGRQSYRLTDTLRSRIEKAKSQGKLGGIPPILAFQSAVDATVSVSALVGVLFDSLPDKGHELILFDINRRKVTESVFSAGADARTESSEGESRSPVSADGSRKRKRCERGYRALVAGDGWWERWKWRKTGMVWPKGNLFAVPRGASLSGNGCGLRRRNGGALLRDPDREHGGAGGARGVANSGEHDAAAAVESLLRLYGRPDSGVPRAGC